MQRIEASEVEVSCQRFCRARQSVALDNFAVVELELNNVPVAKCRSVQHSKGGYLCRFGLSVRGLVIDVGYTSTRVMPVFAGMPVYSALVEIEVHSSLQSRKRWLHELSPSFMDLTRRDVVASIIISA